APAGGAAQRPCMAIKVRGQFALDRLRKHFVRQLRASASQVLNTGAEVTLELESAQAVQAELPLETSHHLATSSAPPPKTKKKRTSSSPGSRRQRRSAQSLSSLVSAQRISGTTDEREAAGGQTASGPPHQPLLLRCEDHDSAGDTSVTSRPAAGPTSTPVSADAGSGPSTCQSMTVSTFVLGPCNRLAHTAMAMTCQTPGANSPLFLCGPSGTGKTHLLTAIADQFRRRHRMRRVIQLSAEQFTNDFITSVGNSGIASFRRRYREVDALLIDDVQFLGAKRATLRELLYTVETLASAGRPLIFSGNQAPTEITGLTGELAGRMAAGLLCPLQPLDQATRETLLRRAITSRCRVEAPEELVTSLTQLISGDGRVIQGVANLINMLQRMFDRIPTLDEIRQFGGELLRANQSVATLAAIEHAVCQTFQLSEDSLRTGSQTRAVSEPRMLAMYLSRELTSEAYA
ncbi:MAG: DnaA/Hda family protein, partial [Pirellulales bacterium]|nr:DnaA/Hda family protein [Pirellulales bacterium]